MKITFTGGGTGGHVFPIIAITREIKKINQSVDLSFVGPLDIKTQELFEKENIRFRKISGGKIRRYSTPIDILKNILDLFLVVPWSIIQSFVHIFIISPDLIFSKGGYGAFPVTIAAKILRTPLFIHESDISPGLTNRKSTKYALEIFTSFNNTEFFPVEKMILVGNPIRKNLLQNINENEIKEKIGLEKKKPIIFVIGGSQGSEKINDLILSILIDVINDFQVIHQCGINNFKKIAIQSDFLLKEEQKKDYSLFSFLDEEQAKYAYHVSDLIISRAGSGSIFEIAAFNKPSILIPLKNSAQDHQKKNAYHYSNCGAALVVEEENTTPNLLKQDIYNIVNNSNKIKEMSEQARNFSKPRSAEIIAQYLIEYLK